MSQCTETHPTCGRTCVLGDGHFGPHRLGGEGGHFRWIVRCHEHPNPDRRKQCMYHANSNGDIGPARMEWIECIYCGHQRPIRHACLLDQEGHILRADQPTDETSTSTSENQRMEGGPPRGDERFAERESPPTFERSISELGEWVPNGPLGEVSDDFRSRSSLGEHIPMPEYVELTEGQGRYLCTHFDSLVIEFPLSNARFPKVDTRIVRAENAFQGTEPDEWVFHAIGKLGFWTPLRCFAGARYYQRTGLLELVQDAARANLGAAGRIWRLWFTNHYPTMLPLHHLDE